MDLAIADPEHGKPTDPSPNKGKERYKPVVLTPRLKIRTKNKNSPLPLVL